MKFKRLLCVLYICTYMSSSFAYTECKRPVKNIWSSMNSAKSVWVTFADNGSAIYKNESQITSGQMARFVSLAIAAQTTGKKLIVRYPDDNLACPPTESRNDFEGVWLTE